MAIKFPSTDFFNSLKQRMESDQARFRRLGFIDTTFGVSIAQNGASRNFVLAFEVFELRDVREVDKIDLAEVDFLIAGEAPVWREMLENIGRNGEADTQHDINTLTHFGEALNVSYVDPEGHDKLYRFMESIQAFFNLSSQIDLSF